MQSVTELEALIKQAAIDLGNGKPVLVADSRERENEVDAIVAAETVLTQWMAWTIRYSSGYICAPMPISWAERLNLPVQWADNEDPKQTCYTVSCDAASGVTTGISAADRCRTLRVLADPASVPADLIRPGHILPLRAKDGGLRQRDGHTEAGVELMQIAGLAPVAAIGELVLDDGSMMRYEQALSFAKAHHLTLLTVEEIKQYLQIKSADEAAIPSGNFSAKPLRAAGENVGEKPVAAEREQNLSEAETGSSRFLNGAASQELRAAQARVEFLGAANLPTHYGDFKVLAFTDRNLHTEHLALIPSWYVQEQQKTAATRPEAKLYREISLPEETSYQLGADYQAEIAPLVRVHSECLTGEALGSLKCDCGPQLQAALEAVMRQGGMVIYLRGQEGRGIGLGQKILAYNLQDQGQDTVEANISLGWPADLRDYTVAGEILGHLGERQIRLLTNNPLKNTLGEIEVSEIIPLEVGVNQHNLAYLQRKQAMGHKFVHDLNSYELNSDEL